MTDDGRHIDTAAAEAYENYLVSRIFGPWAERVVELAAPLPGEAVLDAACGTGAGARIAGPRVLPGGTVAGVDNDAGMIEVARRLAAGSGIDVDWRLESALALPFGDGSFDLCLCLQGPQFLSDPGAGLAELRRVLRPAGRLAASFWCAIEHNKGHFALAQALETRGIAPATRPFSLGDAGEARALFAGAGFKDVALWTEEAEARFPSVSAFIDGVAAGAPATRHALARLADGDRRDFADHVADILAPFTDADGLTLPTRCHIVVARP